MIARESQTVGDCPTCRTPIPSARVLIKYEADGERRMYAECPDCLDVVRPRSEDR